MSAAIQIQVISDFVCPWCYIGKRRLEQALSTRTHLAARIQWLPFQLSPDMPRVGEDRLTHYGKIFGQDKARQILERMAVTGHAEGLQFQLKPGARSPNTLSAHLLLYWASSRPEVDQNQLAERLFYAHHVACEDLGDPQVLARIGGEVGLDPGQIITKLHDRVDEDAVIALTNEARTAGVTGVPFFIFDGRYAISGAQTPEALRQVIDECQTPGSLPAAGV